MGSQKSGSLRARQSPFVTGDALIAIPYEETTESTQPIPITVAPPRAPPTEVHPALRKQHTGDGESHEDNTKRDSGLAPTTSTAAREGSVNTVDDAALGVTIHFDSKASIAPSNQSQTSKISPGTPKHEKDESNGTGSRWRRPLSRNSQPKTPKTPPSISHDSIIGDDFSPITTPIPTESLMDDSFLDGISFSKRGSIMLGGKKGIPGPHARANPGRRHPSFSMLVSPTIKVLSDDLAKESQKVRSMYEQSTGYDWRESSMPSIDAKVNGNERSSSNERPKSDECSNTGGPTKPSDSPSAKSRESILKSQHELAGGLEDWEDLEGAGVDRYGFIITPRIPSRDDAPEPRTTHRVSTVLQLASDAPRKKRGLGRSPSTAASNNSYKKPPSRKVSARSLRTQGSDTSQRSTARSSLRSATNRLPGNRDRRWMDEAGDMLTLPPGLADIAEDEEGGKAAVALKKKEFERTEKWRKMAKVIKSGADGEGMVFEFDTKSAKLIERTWKGIPDRWRAAAWYSFLATSAKKRKDSATDDEIMEEFHKLLDQDSSDDIQIDIDVPRTINRHIMFRRRYRGGQRLLFRVLHCLSLYFPETGYVQGMASLAATLLCYYDEEKTFIMLVRLWTLRGLDKLDEAGFAGLMAALDEFQKHWLRGNDVCKKLSELNIEPTAYGTRWYLTLFNYSIPFPAQLRVWDVFMLLGDSSTDQASNAKSSKAVPVFDENKNPFGGTLDILHATSAALIDGTREILLDSDFENAMKVLTSWIPVKDEELLMRVAKAEWKLNASNKARRKI